MPRRPKRPKVLSWLQREKRPAAPADVCRTAEDLARQAKALGVPFIVPPVYFEYLKRGGCNMDNIRPNDPIPFI